VKTQKAFLNTDVGDDILRKYLEDLEVANEVMTPVHPDLDAMFAITEDINEAHHLAVHHRLKALARKLDDDGLPRWVYTDPSAQTWESRAILFRDNSGIDRWEAAAKTRGDVGRVELKTERRMLNAGKKARAALV
jgi:hypothetical protein